MYTKFVEFVSIIRTNLSRFLQRWRLVRSLLSNISNFSLYDRIRALQKHISISLMAVMFAGGTVITSNRDTNVSLASLFPPDPSVVTAILDEAKTYTPTIQVDTSIVVDKYSNPNSHDYIDQLSILAMAEDNPLDGQGIIYKVEKGDTWSGIAAKFNLKTSSVLAANGIDSTTLKKNGLPLLQPDKNLNIPAEDIDGPKDWFQITQDIAQAKRDQSNTPLNKNKKKLATHSSSATSAALSGGRDFTSRNGYPGGWCTAGVAKFRPDVGRWGNAGNWYRAAAGEGRSVGHDAQDGDIIVTRESGFGHVAYVKNASGHTVTLIDMNYKGRGIYSERTVDDRTIPIIGYIH